MMSVKAFQKKIYDYYATHRREFPWRPARTAKNFNAYKILVSEVMLQQTQVSRVLSFYPRFMKDFSTLQSLAQAPLSQVLNLWQGLGYNRRALMLQQTASAVLRKSRGVIPRNYKELLTLPGIGPSTAAGIMNFAFGVPTPYLETNVRSVYLHFFFPQSYEVGLHKIAKIHDKEILPILEKTMDRKNPREWFYALIDYGVMLKKTEGNPNHKSAHYVKQSPFEGSSRQARAAKLRKALKSGASEKDLLGLLS